MKSAPYEPGKGAHPLIVALEAALPGWSWIPDFNSTRVLLLHRSGYYRWLGAAEYGTPSDWNAAAASELAAIRKWAYNLRHSWRRILPKRKRKAAPKQVVAAMAHPDPFDATPEGEARLTQILEAR